MVKSEEEWIIFPPSFPLAHSREGEEELCVLTNPNFFLKFNSIGRFRLVKSQRLEK